MNLGLWKKKNINLKQNVNHGNVSFKFYVSDDWQPNRFVSNKGKKARVPFQMKCLTDLAVIWDNNWWDLKHWSVRSYFYTISTFASTLLYMFQGYSLLKVLYFVAGLLRHDDFCTSINLFFLSWFAVPNSHYQTWDEFKGYNIFKFRKNIIQKMSFNK